MKITKIVALLLVCALLLGGCSLVSIDSDKVANQVVARVNGTEIYKYEISEDEINYNVEYQSYYAQQLGIEYTQEQLDQMIIDARESALQERVKAEVLLQKAVELSIALTDEEKADNMKEAQDYLDYLKQLFVDQVEQEIADAEAEAAAADTTGNTTADDTADSADADTTTDTSVDEPEATEAPTDPAVLAEAETRYQDYLEKARITLDSYYEELCNQDIIAKVREYCTGFASVTDEEVRTWYDQTLEVQKQEMDEAAGVFESKISGSNIYVYVPQRIVAVRDILIAFDDTLAGDLKTAYDEDNTSQYDALMTASLNQYSDYITTAAEIKSRLDGGEAAADIVEELSAQMENIFDNTPDYGYVIDPRTTSYSENYIKAATKLETVGESSEPFADYDGIHLLVLMKVYEPGVIPFEDLKDSIKTALLPGKQEEKYNEMLDQWIEESKIVYYYDRLNANNDL